MKSILTTSALVGALAVTATAQSAVTQKPQPQKPQPVVTPPTGSFFGGGDDCAAPDVLAGQGTFSYDNTLATTGTEGQNEANCFSFGTSGIALDVWYEWTADATGNATIATCGSTFDTKIAAWPAGGCPADGTSLVCNDDFCGLQSSITFPVTAGTSYLLQCGSFPAGAPASGVAVLDISIAPPPAVTVTADDCATPDMIMGQGSFAYDNTAATTGVEGQNEANCFAFSTSGVALDVWTEWTADVTGDALVSTCGTVFDTKIAAYPAGACPADGTSIACNDDTCGLQSEITFPVTAGTTYLLQLGSFPAGAPASGVADLNISITPTSLGSNYCTAAPNSVSASGSIMSASGSSSLAAQDLTLTANNAPTQPGLFYFGPNQVSLPFGNGTRCVGGSVVRFPIIVASGGSYSYTVDWATFGAALAANPTTNFQCWYRDPAAGGAAFNLSDGYSITWTP